MRYHLTQLGLVVFLIVAGSVVQIDAQVLMLDFDSNGIGEGPFGPAHGDFDGEAVLDDDTDVFWNLIGSDDVEDGIFFSDESDAIGVSVDIGTATGAPDATIDWINTDFATRNGSGPEIFQENEVLIDYVRGSSSTPMGVRISGLEAGAYDVYAVADDSYHLAGAGNNTTFAIYAGTDQGDELTDYSGFESDEIENDVQEGFELGDNYAKFTVTLAPNDSLVLVSDRLPPVTGSGQFNAVQIISTGDGGVRLQAGDADQDFDFDQLDLVKVQIAAKYLTGQIATWGEGDWDGAPGGQPGSPPPGNGLFDQLDIISALGPGHYLTGPYGSIQPGGKPGDEQTSLVYDVSSGELSVDSPSNKDLTSINITSAGNKFIGDKPAVLDGAFDNFGADNIFKATFGGSFGDISFGNVLPAGLSQAGVAADLTAVGSLAGGGDLGDVDLVYIPEPSAIQIVLLAFLGMLAPMRRCR